MPRIVSVAVRESDSRARSPLLAWSRDNEREGKCEMEKLVYANTITYYAPDALTDLEGLASGVVELPRYLYWGPGKNFDLSDWDDVQRMYQPVVRIGSAADQIEWLNRDILVNSWPKFVLPARCKALWESRFPELVTSE